MKTLKELNNLVYQVNGAAIEVHKHLGPGLLESVYQECLAYELTLRNIKFLSENHLPINYKGYETSTNLRYDFFIEDILVIELKAVDEMKPIFDAQILTYMKLLKAPQGLLINFNVKRLYDDGVKSFVNEFYYDFI
jgi:GxxExxY protein